MSEHRGKTIAEICVTPKDELERLLFRPEKTIIQDCYFCKERKRCKNPNSRNHTEKLTPNSVFYTCAAYLYGPTINEKPKTKEPYFDPQRLAALTWAVSYIDKQETKEAA